MNTSDDPDRVPESTDPAVVELDALDHSILSMLQADGRMPYRQIAREVGTSEGTVRARVGRMQSSGVLNIVAIADPFRLGYNVLAFVLLRSRSADHGRIIDELTSWTETTYVSSCVGSADIYMQIVCRDNAHLGTLLHSRLPAIDGVESVETFVELKMHKVSYTYNED
ncbi:Lrp/AsnC family transcriptional regulator [Gordonia malaquae]|uniref:Lrp/AsnC family transcriptional regulator n=1 Tax=Gordonia malaquae TaxID=410332 RepID=UPI00301971C4